MPFFQGYESGPVDDLISCFRKDGRMRIDLSLVGVMGVAAFAALAMARGLAADPPQSDRAAMPRSTCPKVGCRAIWPI